MPDTQDDPDVVERVAASIRQYFVTKTGFGTEDADGCVSAYYGGNWIALSPTAIARAALSAKPSPTPVDRDIEGLVERVARALCADEQHDPDTQIDDGPKWWTYYSSAARAAIAALQSPAPVQGECPSCGGLNLSCPGGCGRDPETGELNGTRYEPVQGAIDTAMVERVSRAMEPDWWAWADVHFMADHEPDVTVRDALLERARRAIAALSTATEKAPQGDGAELVDPLQSHDKFDGVGPHSETIEARASIGERYLDAYESALHDPLLAGYMPMDCPSELLLDLLEKYRTALTADAALIAELREALQKIADQPLVETIVDPRWANDFARRSLLKEQGQ